MVVGCLEITLRIPEAHSLKDKRNVVRSLKDRLRSKFNVSVAELGDLEKWQTATLGFVAIGNDNRYVDGILQGILRLIETYPEVEITGSRIEFL